MDDAPERRHTASDLVADAAAAGMPASARLITDWVAKGLLDRPRVRGLGRGKGTVATWPESQRRLLLALLEHRQRGVKRLATLCNMPVALWLDSEGLDDEYVPLRQVRRCLATWGATHKATSTRAARYTAELLIEEQSSPQLSRRARHALIDAVVDATGSGPLDRVALRTAALEVFRSERFAELWVRTVEARFTALSQLDGFDDATFHTARSMVNASAAIYIDRELGEAAREDLSRERAFELLNELAGNACGGLLTSLGLLELTRQQGSTIPDNSPPRPLTRPGGTAHGGTAPWTDPKLPRRSSAASSWRTATGSRSASRTGI
jgi:hypothetical protein